MALGFGVGREDISPSLFHLLPIVLRVYNDFLLSHITKSLRKRRVTAKEYKGGKLKQAEY